MPDYIVTLIHSSSERVDSVWATSMSDAARAVHGRRHDPVGSCYSVRGPDVEEEPVVQVMPDRVRIMRDRPSSPGPRSVRSRPDAPVG